MKLNISTLIVTFALSQLAIASPPNKANCDDLVRIGRLVDVETFGSYNRPFSKDILNLIENAPTTDWQNALRINQYFSLTERPIGYQRPELIDKSVRFMSDHASSILRRLEMGITVDVNNEAWTASEFDVNSLKAVVRTATEFFESEKGSKAQNSAFRGDSNRRYLSIANYYLMGLKIIRLVADYDATRAFFIQNRGNLGVMTQQQFTYHKAAVMTGFHYFPIPAEFVDDQMANLLRNAGVAPLRIDTKNWTKPTSENDLTTIDRVFWGDYRRATFITRGIHPVNGHLLRHDMIYKAVPAFHNLLVRAVQIDSPLIRAAVLSLHEDLFGQERAAFYDKFGKSYSKTVYNWASVVQRFLAGANLVSDKSQLESLSNTKAIEQVIDKLQFTSKLAVEFKSNPILGELTDDQWRQVLKVFLSADVSGDKDQLNF